MIPTFRPAACAVVLCLLTSGCGQKGPIFLPKDEPAAVGAPDKATPKPKPKPQLSPKPEASPEPEEPSPDEDPQDGYAPTSDQPDF